jgi:hypothetical protein
MSAVIEKTHYRKAFNSPYLSSADIVEPTVLTIKYVRLELDQTKKTKDLFNTAHFAETEIRPGEKLKPMILNAFNSTSVKDLVGSHFIDDWNNVPVNIYVDTNVKFGRDTVEGLRISRIPPVLQKPELTPTDKEKWLRAVAAYKANGNLDIVLKHVTISPENVDLIKTMAI